MPGAERNGAVTVNSDDVVGFVDEKLQRGTYGVVLQ